LVGNRGLLDKRPAALIYELPARNNNVPLHPGEADDE
jgi:hypothetical protein